MDYYRCPYEALTEELQRRGYDVTGSKDQLSEMLKRDDEARGSAATTVRTDAIGHFLPNYRHPKHDLWKSVPAGALLGKKITYWSMNTFFPTLQLFFESGQSCTIGGKQSTNIKVGLDPELRFRLTDCTHEEDGRIVKSSKPEKFAKSDNGLIIRSTIIARRRSIATAPIRERTSTGFSMSSSLGSTIIEVEHIVVGLRLGGMNNMAYVWARIENPSAGSDTWADVRIAGLRSDIPAPVLGYPPQLMMDGGPSTVVIKTSMIQTKDP